MSGENRTQQATLGCGTFILIALIVLLFSRAGNPDLERDVRAVRSEVAGLNAAMAAQTLEIKALRETIDRLRAAKEGKAGAKD